MRKNYIVIVVVALVIVAAAGLFLSNKNKNKTAKNESSAPTSSSSTTNSSSPAPSNSGTGEVTISGAVNKSFKIVSSEVIPGGGMLKIGLVGEGNSDSIGLEIPENTKPGTYPIEQNRKSYNPGVYAAYGVASDNGGSTDYLSNTGTLTLKSISTVDLNSNTGDTGKFSGEFQFTAVLLSTSEKIDVKGSFADVPLVRR